MCLPAPASGPLLSADRSPPKRIFPHQREVFRVATCGA